MRNVFKEEELEKDAVRVKYAFTVGFVLNYEDASHIVQSMKVNFDSLFGIEKDQGFKSALGTIYQTFDGKRLQQ